MTAAPLFQRVALLGLGLIGSSLAHAMRRHGLAGPIAGHARSRRTRDKALELGFIDSVHATPGECVERADLVVVCVPIGAYAEIGAAISAHLARGCIVSDVGSVKQAVIRDLGPVLPEGVHFV